MFDRSSLQTSIDIDLSHRQFVTHVPATILHAMFQPVTRYYPIGFFLAIQPCFHHKALTFLFPARVAILQSHQIHTEPSYLTAVWSLDSRTGAALKLLIPTRPTSHGLEGFHSNVKRLKWPYCCTERGLASNRRKFDHTASLDQVMQRSLPLVCVKLFRTHTAAAMCD